MKPINLIFGTLAVGAFLFSRWMVMTSFNSMVTTLNAATVEAALSVTNGGKIILGTETGKPVLIQNGDAIDIVKPEWRQSFIEANQTNKSLPTNIGVLGQHPYNTLTKEQAEKAFGHPIKGFDEGLEKEIEKRGDQFKSYTNSGWIWYSNTLYTGTITFATMNVTNVEIPSVITNMRTVNGHWLFQMSETERMIAPSDDGRTNIVNQLVTSGEFCKVRGHTWSEECTVFIMHDSARPRRLRRCDICFKSQIRSLGEWETFEERK